MTKQARNHEKYLVIANGRIIAEKSNFAQAVKHTQSIEWAYDVFDEILIAQVVVFDAKKEI